MYFTGSIRTHLYKLFTLASAYLQGYFLKKKSPWVAHSFGQTFLASGSSHSETLQVNFRAAQYKDLAADRGFTGPAKSSSWTGSAGEEFGLTKPRNACVKFTKARS